MHVFARFCTFLHGFAHRMYLRYMNTYYKVMTFNSTDFLFLNTVLHITDLIIHDFELHMVSNSPKNVHLKALLYMKISWEFVDHCMRGLRFAMSLLRVCNGFVSFFGILRSV